MGGNASDTLGHLAGYGVGALSALTSIKGGGLQNWLLNRQRAVEDPSIRASLVGSPFASGMLFQSGGDVAAPGSMPAAGGIAAPDDIRWLQQQSPARHFIPDLPPLPAEVQVQTRAAQGIVSGLQSADPVVRAQAKVAGRIPLTAEETGAIVGAGRQLQGGLGPGGTVGIEAPGMPITIGSPYSVSPGVAPDEFATYGEAAAAASQRGTGWTVQQTNRGTFKPVQITQPLTPPAPVAAPAPAPAPAAPAPAPAPRPGARPGAPEVPSSTMPPPPPSPPPPPPPTPRPAPAPRAAAPPPAPVRTGTPALTAGQVVIPMPPPAPPYVGGPYDPNAPAPSSAPFVAPPGRVGYPSGAFLEEPSVAPPSGSGFFSWLGPSAAEAAEAPPAPAQAPVARAPIPEYQPAAPRTGITTPPIAEPPPQRGATRAPESPTTGMPIVRETVTGAGGTTYTYDYGSQSTFDADKAAAGITSFEKATPEQRADFDRRQLAREQRSKISDADISRLMRPASPGEAAGNALLLGYRGALDKFMEDFPDAAERDQFVGWYRRPMIEWMAALRTNKRFGQFVKDLSDFQGFDDVRGHLPDFEQSDLSGHIPTGHESQSEYFEQNLNDFDERLNEDIGLRLALQQMPVGQQTAGWANSLRAQWAQERAARKAAALGAPALGQGGETPPTVPLATTTTTTQPPSTTTLPPLVIFGHSPLY